MSAMYAPDALRERNLFDRAAVVEREVDGATGGVFVDTVVTRRGKLSGGRVGSAAGVAIEAEDRVAHGDAAHVGAVVAELYDASPTCAESGAGPDPHVAATGCPA